MQADLLPALLLFSLMGILFVFLLLHKHSMNDLNRIKRKEQLRLENEKREFEQRVAILQATQEERNRISADLHDELGSGLTAIRLLSEIVKLKMKGQSFPEMEKISSSANELLLKMNMIIWTLASAHDSVESLVAYIRNFAEAFFENTGIEFHFDMPACSCRHPLNSDKRRNVFLCVKEVLHNTLKHSGAREVSIHISVEERLVIEIQDDGMGILPEKIRRFGNGLSNIQKRMLAVNGTCLMENRPGARTVLELDWDEGAVDS